MNARANQVLLKTRVHSNWLPSLRVRTTLLEKADPPLLTTNLASGNTKLELEEEVHKTIQMRQARVTKATLTRWKLRDHLLAIVTPCVATLKQKKMRIVKMRSETVRKQPTICSSPVRCVCTWRVSIAWHQRECDLTRLTRNMKRRVCKH